MPYVKRIANTIMLLAALATGAKFTTGCEDKSYGNNTIEERTIPPSIEEINYTHVYSNQDVSISTRVRDARGIHTDSVEAIIMSDSSIEKRESLEQISGDEYEGEYSNSFRLASGDYKLNLSASDLDGNRATGAEQDLFVYRCEEEAIQDMYDALESNTRILEYLGKGIDGADGYLLIDDEEVPYHITGMLDDGTVFIGLYEGENGIPINESKIEELRDKGLIVFIIDQNTKRDEIITQTQSSL
jgi:hypothetical protein